jgi:hypothetical protein
MVCLRNISVDTLHKEDTEDDDDDDDNNNNNNNNNNNSNSHDTLKYLIYSTQIFEISSIRQQPSHSKPFRISH